MRYVPANCIRENMILGRQLIGKNGELLLSKGSNILPSYIERIKELGYSGIYVEDTLSEDIEISEIISENLRNKAVKTVKETFYGMESGKRMEDCTRNLADLVNNMVDEILSNRDAMVNMIDLKVFDNYTFYHSVNVSVLSMVTGASLNLNKHQLYNLGLSALLHDIGKVFIPKEILNKNGELTPEEFETIKTHSYKGYQYLREKSQIPPSAFVGILQHHERYDGTGYPGEIKGSQISLFGRIISITDVYDALTSDRPYRKAMFPSEAVEYIMGGGGTMFDSEVAGCFTQRIAPYPVGVCVRLSNNKAGIVVKNYSDCCLRPKVKIVMHGNEKVEPYFIDLRNDKNAIHVTITAIADIEQRI